MLSKRFNTLHTLEYGLKSADMVGMPIKHSIENAQALLRGELVLNNLDIHETIPFTIEGFDWNVQLTQSPTTAQMFLQGLSPVAYLTGGFVLTEQDEMFRLAGKFIHSWMNTCPEKITLEIGVYYWDQHSVALRTEALLYYLLVGKERGLLAEGEEDALCLSLEKHGWYLANEMYYLNHQNHGVFQDRALLYLSRAFKREDWLSLAVKRVEEQWRFLFGDNGVCIENSFTYQRVDKDLFLDIAKFLRKLNCDNADMLWDGILKAEEFMGFALLPDGASPPYGDSLRYSYLDARALDEHGALAYLIGNKKAEKPKTTSVAYEREGYYFGREFWAPAVRDDRKSREDPFWVMFRSGYQSITHRQADDNSFILYARGFDVFVDSGVYSYMFRDPIRQYVRSANAHNTIVVDGKSSQYLRADCQGMSGFICNELDRDGGCDYVAAFNKLYRGVTHVRHFMYFSTDVLLVDELFSRNEHEYSQLFHCGRRTELINCGKETSCLQLGDSGFNMLLSQREPCDDVQVFFGNREGTLYGNVSESFNVLFPTHTLKYDKRAIQCVFITLMSLTDEAGVSISGLTADVDMDARQVTAVWKDGRTCRRKLCDINIQNLGPQFRFPMNDIQVELLEDAVQFTNLNAYQDRVEYAWYLIGEDGKTIVDRTNYTTSPVYIVSKTLSVLTDGVCYTIRAFVFCKRGKFKAAQNVAKITLIDGAFQIDHCLDYDNNLAAWEKC